MWKFRVLVDLTAPRMVPFIRRRLCLHEARACNIKMTAHPD